MKVLRAVFNILLSYELFLTYPIYLEVYKILTFAKAYVLIPYGEEEKLPLCP